MKDSPPLCIIDTNILIDLHVGGLLQEIFAPVQAGGARRDRRRAA